jgi:hypothetical protein
MEEGSKDNCSNKQMDSKLTEYAAPSLSIFLEKKYMHEERHLKLVPKKKKEKRWRVNERTKTVTVAIVYCLNIGVDPPDIIKPVPCARLECWIDPLSLPPQQALEKIAKSLQSQYEARAKKVMQTRCSE